MTRINTNISSLTAQLQLHRNLDAQQTAIQRLSTGLRINSAKDDPSGMVASTTLQTEITSTHQAIANCQRANQLLMTADSALGQITRLLDEVRGLISEAANSGAMSAAQIAANQLQIDASLEAIDRIANMTQFEGRKLLDGSLEFRTYGVDTNRITDLRIDQADFGQYDELGVAVQVVQPARQARLQYAFGAIAEDVVLEIGGRKGFEAFTLAAGASITDVAQAVNLVSDATGVRAVVQREATAGTVTLTSFGPDNDIVLTADQPGRGAGDFRVLYTADPHGNPNLGIDYTASDGENPATINIRLRTQIWQAATYTYNGGYDSTANNAFQLQARQPGPEMNGPAGTGIVFTIVDTPGGPAGVAYNHGTGEFTLSVDYNGGVGGTSVNEIRAILEADPYLNTLFEMTDALGSDGTGPIVPSTPVHVQQLGVQGGAVLSTADEVIAAINRAATPGDPNPLAGLVTAALAPGNTGITTVTPFEDYAYHGRAEANNQLQFLGPAGTRPIRFVSTPGGMLEVDLTSDPPVYGHASLLVQGLDRDTSITLRALKPGPDYDGVKVVLRDAPDPGVVPWDATESAVWNAETKTVTLTVNFTHRALNDPPGDLSLPRMLDMVNLNPVVGRYFQAAALDPTFDPLAPPAFDSAAYRDLCAAHGPIDMGSLQGGVKSQGAIVIHLETGADGLVRSTAADLVKYFNHPPGDLIATQLAELGVSVTLIGGSDGTGKLAATAVGQDVHFTTSGVVDRPDFARVTIRGSEGIDGLFDIRARRLGPSYDGVMVQIVPDSAADPGVPVIRYDETARILTVGVRTGAGVTSTADVIREINAYAHPTLGQVFAAEATKNVFGIPGLDSQATADAPQTYVTATLAGGIARTGSPTGVPMLGNSDQADTGLAFVSADYGSDAFVSVQVLNGADFQVRNAAGVVTSRDTGHDIEAIINDVRAVGSGRTAIINTSTLDMRLTLSEDVRAGELVSFRLTGGGMQIQIGIDVQATQQARLGIPSVATSKLGGYAGRLFEIRSGGAKDLATDVIGAARIVDEVSKQVSYLRGRIGAFQSMTLETNMLQMQDALESLVEANSQIRDADFAQETSQLTRAEILVQSGMQVLSIANNTPKNVLSLLQNQR